MKTLTKIFSGLVLAALAVSCSDWTDTEPLKVKYETLESKNHGLYEAYMASVRAYHATQHQVLIAKFDNKAEAPSGRADHINCLPDSVDYVILKNADNLSDAMVSEMAENRQLKAIPTLMQISYNAFESEYKAMVAAEEEKAALDPTYTAPGDSLGRFVPWMEEKVSQALKVADKYGYDGVNIIYSGKNPLSLREEGKADLSARQEAFFGKAEEWMKAHQDKLVFFEGTPKYILAQTSVLEKAKYIIIPALSCVSSYDLSYTVNQNISADVPSGKFIVGVTTISVTDPTDNRGKFNGTDENGKSLTAITGAAYWTAVPESNYTKAGLCVDNAQVDYYNITKVYSNIGKAISIMNPSPEK